MAVLKKLSINGYKSIDKLENFSLNNLNVLIGANGAGKSNFINLFVLLKQIRDEKLQLHVNIKGGANSLLHHGSKNTERLHAEFYFELNGYIFDLMPTEDERLIFEKEMVWFKGHLYSSSPTCLLGTGHLESKLKEAQDKYSPYIRKALDSWRVYHFHDTGNSSLMKKKHAINDNLFLKTDGANLAAYLHKLRQEYPTHYQNIVNTIQLVAPFFADFVERLEPANDIQLEWFHINDTETPFTANMLSDGTLRFICLMTLLLQPPSLLPDTILIDEPELGLHPYAISVLADIFRQVTEQQKQLIVSTQSVELINELSPEDIIVVEQNEGASTFQRYTSEALANWLKDYSLGEIWKKNILGGRP